MSSVSRTATSDGARDFELWLVGQSNGILRHSDARCSRSIVCPRMEVNDMEILTASTDQERFAEAMCEIEDWRLAIPPWGGDSSEHCKIMHDHYLGTSPNGQLWDFVVHRSQSDFAD